MIGYPKPGKVLRKKKRVKNERKALIKACDDLVRQIMRFSRPHTCICCGKTAEQIGWFGGGNTWGMTVGHLISRKIYVLRWDLANCEYQCQPCNALHERDELPYFTAYVRKNGIEALERLKNIRQQYRMFTKTMTTPHIREIKEELERVKASYQPQPTAEL